MKLSMAAGDRISIMNCFQRYIAPSMLIPRKTSVKYCEATCYVHFYLLDHHS